MGNKTEPDPMERMLENLVTCQRLTLLGRLSTIITHEANNQLTGVSGYAQLLLGQERAGPVEKELGKINSAAGRCQKLIADMRRIGRFGPSENEFDNINFIIKFSLDLLRHEFEKKTLQIVENYSTDIPAIEVDTPALEQVFLNIIQNSLEALGDEGSCVTVTTLMEEKQIVAIFEDDGPGLSPNALAHLFTPFFTTKTRLHCPGLGLAASKSIVEAHGGTIRINSSPTGGACVRINLPCEE